MRAPPQPCTRALAARRLGRIAAALAAAVALAALAAAPAGASPGSVLDRAMDRVMKQEGAPPGMLALIRARGGNVVERRGVANVANGAALRPNLRIRIASMSKALNGAVVMALAARGKLGLDDTIGEWLPGLWPKASEVTVAQLLRHTGGLPDYIEEDDFLDHLGADPTGYLSPRELIGFVDDKDPEFTPGTEYDYSDSDNVVAGLIAERAAGRSYDDLLERFVYRKARMPRSSLPRTVEMPRPYVRGYDVLGGGGVDDVSEYINPALAWASGGIVSTPREMGRFFRAYVGGRLFDWRAMGPARGLVEGSSSPPGPGANSAGAALFRYRSRCGTMIGHTGSFPGYRLFGAASRNGKRSVVFVVNAQIVPPDQGSQRVSRLIRRAQVAAVCRALR